MNFKISVIFQSINIYSLLHVVNNKIVSNICVTRLMSQITSEYYLAILP